MFRLIEDSFWDDPQIARLARDEKLITICLFTNVHTRPCGIYRITADRIAHMTGIPEAKIRKGLNSLTKDDIAYYDGTEVCIPGYIRRQRYKGPQMARRVVSELATVKNKSFIKIIADRYPDFLKAGGFKMGKNDEFIPPPLFSPDPADTLPAKKKNAGIENLSLYMADKLKFTGGIKPAILAKLVKADPDGEAGVMAAVDRAVKYYATAKAEKWKAFIIAKRFSKFCDFYGEAFSSKEALEIYIVKIRTANEREDEKDKDRRRREANLHVVERRQEPELPGRDPWSLFLEKLPEPLESLRADFEKYYQEKDGEEILTNKLLALFKDNGELNLKTECFIKNLKPIQRKPETMLRYRKNFLFAKFAIPEILKKDEEV